MDHETGEAEEQSPQAVAYHEAGHAAVSVLLRLPFQYVTVEPGDGALGHVAWQWPKRDLEQLQFGDSRAFRAKAEDYIVSMLAGVEAQTRYLGREPQPYGGQSDREQAIDIALALMGTEQAEAFLDWLIVRTRDIVGRPLIWRGVEVVAAALLARRRLRSREVRALVFEAQRRP